MTTEVDDQTSIPPGFTAIEHESLSQLSDNIDFIYNDEYDYESEPSVYSEPVKKTGGGIKRVSLLSKEGLIRIRCEVPRELRETVGRKYLMVPVYETPLSCGRRIKNAITGLTTPFRVGTHAESLFFKVCWAVGIDGRKDPIILFFETPAEYEKHFLVSVPDAVKAEWTERRIVVENAYRRREEKEKEQNLTFIR